jgi:branched-chain amino acid transport system ATP-binding protein
VNAVLECRSLSVRFGSFRALHKVTMSLGENLTYAVIGPNGAGKTTLINVLSGLITPSEGDVLLNDQVVTPWGVERRARMGIGRSFQIIKLFPEMSARENLRIAAQRVRYRLQPFWRVAGSDATVERAVNAMLERIGLVRWADGEAGLLSHGMQRALELGLTLMTKPRVLLLDEPLAGVGNDELPEMLALLNAARRECTTLIVEHNMEAVMSVADEVIVLVAGEVLTQGTPADVSSNSQVRAAYLGG